MRSWIYGSLAIFFLAAAMLLPGIGSYYAEAGPPEFVEFCSADSPTYVLSRMAGIFVVVLCIILCALCTNIWIEER